MGRVKSRIKHDFKSGRQEKNQPLGLRPVPAAIAGIAVASALLISFNWTGDDDASPIAGPANDRTDAVVPVGSATQRTRVQLTLPRTADDSAEKSAKPQAEATTPGETHVRVEAAPRETQARVETTPVTAEAQVDADVAIKETAAKPPMAALIVEVKPGDSLDRIFRRNNLSVADLAAMLSIKEAKKSLKKIKPGDLIEITHDQKHVLSLSRRLGETVSLRIVAEGSRYRTEFITHPVEVREAVAQNRIDSSLFVAGSDAGMSDALIMNLAGIFAWDIDFALEIRKGDSFALLYEVIWQDGRRLRDGDILAAEFINQGKTYRAIRFKAPDGKVEYYTPEGLNVRKAFLRAPLDFSRVSSNFNPNRLHPILKTNRPHRGVDYAANKGTPIKAAGDGTIIFRGRNGGYGNCVIIQHGGNVTTLYAHLSKFAGGRKKGSRIRQGQILGYVGSTGLATAAHLHYEYRLNGVHRNPRTVALPPAQPVPEKYRSEFEAAIQPLLSRLDAMSPAQLAAVR
jgi:murein DD-endopeptidase MepM/ murein hydrolase activator NlpD